MIYLTTQMLFYNLMRNGVYTTLKKFECGVIIDMKLWNIYWLTLNCFNSILMTKIVA